MAVKKKEKKVVKRIRFLDNSPPKIDMMDIAKPKLWNNIVRSTRELDMGNMDLVQKLYKVYLSSQTTTFRKSQPELRSNLMQRIDQSKYIEKLNLKLAKYISCAVPLVTTRHKVKKMYYVNRPKVKKEIKKKIEEDKLVDAPPIDAEQFITEKSSKYPDKRPRVCIKIAVEDLSYVANMVVVLYSDYLPRTCEKFVKLCKDDVNDTYKGCKVHQIFSDFFCVMGDVAYDQNIRKAHLFDFHHENYTLSHAEPGVLTMNNTIKGCNSSEFLITFKPLKSMDGKYVAFGKIISGLETLKFINGFGRSNGYPLKKLWISEINEI